MKPALFYSLFLLLFTYCYVNLYKKFIQFVSIQNYSSLINFHNKVIFIYVSVFLITCTKITHTLRAHGWTCHELRGQVGVYNFVCAGSWVHSGYHLTTSIVAPPLLSLPFAFASLGWVAGVISLVIGAVVTFYSYNLISLVLEHHAHLGHRYLRFRDMANHILGTT